MKTNKTMIHSRLGRLVGPATLALGLMVGSSAFGQILPIITTTIESTTFAGDPALRILQSGSNLNSSSQDVRFVFDRLLEVDPGSFDNSGWSLAEVNVTIRMLTEGASLKLENDSETEDFVGALNDKGSITFTFNSFSLGANTSPLAGGSADINSGSFLVENPVAELDLNNVTLTPGQFIEVLDQGFDRTESRPVHSNFFSDYDGTETFNFDLSALFAVTFSGSGSDLKASQNFGNSTFFTEVEYIVIPEPGTIALMAIALGGAGGLAFLRRRKRV